MVAPECLRHHRQGEQTQHVLLARLRQRNAHGARRNGLDAGPLVEQAELRYPFGHKFVEREGDIAGGNRAAIMKTGVRIEGYLHPREIIGVARVCGNERIIAARFIIGGGEQRVVQSVGTYSRVAAQRIAVEVIEGANAGVDYCSPFRGTGIGIIKMVKADGVFRFANDGKSAALFYGYGLRLTIQAEQGQ